MSKIERFIDYLFSLKGTLNRRSYFFHYFLDMPFFFVLMLIADSSLPVYTPYIEKIKILDMSLAVIIFAITLILVVALFIMNRLSILLRRLRYLKMNSAFCLLLFLPIVGLLFDFYLLIRPDED
jgi:uncharacterized membrane protein YhaH (DUF805 family)